MQTLIGNFNRRWRLYFSETPFVLIGHFRVPKTLAFKTRLTAKPLLWKLVLYMRIRKKIHINDNNSNNNNNNEIIIIKNLYSAYPALP